MGAYGLAVAAAFAVALAVLLSVASTSVAEAKTVTLSGDTADAEPGDTVIIPGPENSTLVNFSITGGSASGSFTSGGGDSVDCSDRVTASAGSSCDVENEAGIAVKLDIDADSGDGYIIVKRDVILPTTGATDDSVVITVNTLPKPASLTGKAAQTTIAAADGNSAITATVKNNKSPSVGMNDQLLTFVTTLGTMTCPGSAAVGTSQAIDMANNVQWCQVRTSNSGTPQADGNAVVTLNGTGREGTATLTISHGTLDPASVDVTLFGTAKNLAAAADQGSVEQGGKVFVILTVTDAAGNPVSGALPVPGDPESSVRTLMTRSMSTPRRRTRTPTRTLRTRTASTRTLTVMVRSTRAMSRPVVLWTWSRPTTLPSRLGRVSSRRRAPTRPASVPSR